MSAVNQCYVLTHKTGYGSVWHAYRWLYANRRVPGSVLGCGKWCFVRVFDHFRPLLVAVIYWFESKMCEDAVLLFVCHWLVSFRGMVCCFAECVQEGKDRVAMSCDISWNLFKDGMRERKARSGCLSCNCFISL